MDEKDIINKSQGSEALETSKWSKRAVRCVYLGYLTPVLWLIFTAVLAALLLSDTLSTILGILEIVVVVISFLFILAGLGLGIFALIHIAINKGKIQGSGKAVNAIGFSLLFLLVGGIIIPAIARVRKISQREICGDHLFALGESLENYANEYGKYPPADKWCDILLQNNYATEDIFKCPFNERARCSYSINPNCEPNSPPDVILVFESKGGWNSRGGPELFTAEHHDGYGGNILYNDGHVKFERTDPNGRVYDGINWGGKEKGRD